MEALEVRMWIESNQMCNKSSWDCGKKETNNLLDVFDLWAHDRFVGYPK